MFMMYRIARLFKLALFILFVLTLYFLLDRWLYERLLNSLYITFDDFPLDYAEAMKSLSNDDRFYEEYNYAQTPKYNTSVPLDTTIPPIIHFIWFENLYETTDVTNIPSMGSNAPHRCQKVNPDFDVKVWNASAARDLLEQYYDWFLPTYDNYPYPIQRVDAIKYFVLHHYGGFYLDLDITCRRSLTPLRPFPAWVPRASPQGVNNDALAFAKNHKAMDKFLWTLRRRARFLVFPYLTIFCSTGPQFTTDVIKEYLDEYYGAGHVRYSGGSKYPSDPDAIYVLPQEFYSEEYTFFGHSPGGTWHEGDVAVVLWFVAHPWFVMFLVASFMIGCILFAYRPWKRRKLAGYTPLRNEEEAGLELPVNGQGDISSSGAVMRKLLLRIRAHFNLIRLSTATEIDTLSTIEHAKDNDDASQPEPSNKLQAWEANC